MLTTYKLLVDWDNNGNYTGTYDDISADVIGTVDYEYGREHPIPLPGVGFAPAGQLTATLDNSAGKYSSRYTSSPIYGLIKAGRPCRLVGRVSGTDYTIWTGYLQRVEPGAPDPNGTGTAKLTAWGPLSRLVDKEVSPLPANSGALTGTLMALLLDAAGIDVLAYSVDAGLTTTSRWYEHKVAAIEAARRVESTELGFLREDADGLIVFEDRARRTSAAHSTTSQASFSDQNDGAIPIDAAEQIDTDDGVVNEVVVTVPGFSVGALAVVWTYPGTAPEIGPGQTRTFIAEYPNPGNATGAYVETWSTPSIGTDIIASGVASSDLEVATVFASTTALGFKGPNHMRIQIRNNHAINVATLTTLQARGTPVSFGDSVAAMSEDTTSKSTYGRKSLDAAGPWLPSILVGESYADYVVDRYADPIVAIRIGYCASRSTTAAAAAFTLELSDRITVRADGRTKLGIASSAWFIERIAGSIEVDGLHHVTYDCSPAVTETYWILGTSDLGTDTILSF